MKRDMDEEFRRAKEDASEAMSERRERVREIMRRNGVGEEEATQTLNDEEEFERMKRER